MACGSRHEGDLSSDLLGRWVTSEPKYHHRYFEIQRDQLVWGVGEYELEKHRLEKVEWQPEANQQMRYWLHYTETAGYPHALEILIQRGARLTLRFANRPEVWTRAPPG